MENDCSRCGAKLTLDGDAVEPCFGKYAHKLLCAECEKALLRKRSYRLRLKLSYVKNYASSLFAFVVIGTLTDLKRELRKLRKRKTQNR